MEYQTIILMIWFHFVSDFGFQNDWIALNKSENIYVLILHSLLYSILFFYFGWIFAILNGILHFMIDYGSSKLTKYYYVKENRRMFFLIIGFDQAIHMTILFMTYCGLFK